ncbi:MAG: 16S rRNA (uracil(1498)-N(3))-methyltransferase [Zoogloeaceae bacterium]|jgi:16S rRNA (uracil1498-N3)-methyltransferase|nr:16S rRNA (uracil(1498)-N(3))-methyltransferase [Zoogloeaceae bacterium]
MSTPRFFCPPAFFTALSAPASAPSLELPRDVARHAARVLRLPTGARITLFDGSGNEFPAVIETVGRADSVRVRLDAPRSIPRESPLAITLLQTIQAADKMDFTIQKAVELGVAVIRPLAGRRSVVRLAGERRVKREAHWQSVAIAACEQCGRNHVPAVAPVASLEDWLAREGKSVAALKLMLAPRAEKRLRDLPRAREILLLVGAEGGFAPEETEMAKEAGFTAVSLGPRVLRTETAGLAAIAALQALWGDG